VTALLALWNDLAPGREAEYDTWHTREHVPERVAAPGFRSGRRYVAPAHPAHRWFTLYEVADHACLDTPEYRDLLANPTPWSASMRPDFRHFLRVPCTPLGAAGFGIGGALAVLRLPDEAALPVLAELAQAEGIVRAVLARRAETGGGFRLGQGESGASDDFATVLMLDALDEPAATRAFAAAAARFALGRDPLSLGGVYRLAFIFPGSDPAERAAHRRQAWG